ncbi:hypothetical protein QN379_17885 [Glaciimonas sp. Gout2]|uniref:hypothetical protein n=1 Tax=unclassified Glaciimonas TaxID=2644401 RepID=UPI002B223945|nr:MULTISPECIES: hypothetical protein [unclassified Glaciimonas]MEB0012126.1 hypothetical protein [Glaciimonas sp. Cout2]MEB0083882.1 hypothetical protein [Glaciimonas sp. Gout2]
MNRLYALKILLVVIAISGLVTGFYIFKSQQYDQFIFFIACVTWVVWVSCAVLKNSDLPAPFGYNQGENQIPRIAYLIMVLGFFFYMVFF